MDNDKNYFSDMVQKELNDYIWRLHGQLETKDGEIATLIAEIDALEHERELYRQEYAAKHTDRNFTEPPIQAAEGIRIEELTI